MHRFTEKSQIWEKLSCVSNRFSTVSDMILLWNYYHSAFTCVLELFVVDGLIYLKWLILWPSEGHIPPHSVGVMGCFIILADKCLTLIPFYSENKNTYLCVCLIIDYNFFMFWKLYRLWIYRCTNINNITQSFYICIYTF